MTKRTLILAVLLAAPIVVLAQDKTVSGLVPCGNSTGGGPVTASQQCEFQDLLKLVQTILNYLIYGLATPVAILMFAYAGFKLVWSQGDTGAEKAARTIFTNTLIGYAAMLAAFLIVKLIFSFIFPDTFSLLG